MTAEELLPLVENALKAALSTLPLRSAIMIEAAGYAVLSPGKRIRPLIALGAAVACGGKVEDALPAAVAIELLHNYTLVHDDLPAMDNDELRRGQPTLWKRFGEDNAILCGDLLQALAFAEAAKVPRNADKVVSSLAKYATGVVLGQVEDVLAMRVGRPLTEDDVDFIYLHKTADLFKASAEMGAWAAGANLAQVKALSLFAENLGMAFQYEDDLLDGDSPFDEAETKRRALAATTAAKQALASLSGDTAFLLALSERLLARRN